MNLYVIEKKQCSYDTVEKFLIVASDIFEVLSIAIAKTCGEEEWNEDNVDIKIVGTASENTRPGVIMDAWKDS